MIQNLISINVVIRKVIKDLGIDDKELYVDDIIEWIGEGLQYIGAYYQYCERTATIYIEDYKGELPCDYHSLIRLHDSTDSKSDSFNKNLIGNSTTLSNRNQHTSRDYNIQGGLITTAFKKGSLYIQYLGIPLDEDGFPMIPDNINYLDALMWKCAYQLSIKGYTFKSTQLNDYRYVESKWQRYCLQARANINMPDGDTLERLKNIMIRFKPDLNQYYNNFDTLGKQQAQRQRGNYRTNY